MSNFEFSLPGNWKKIPADSLLLTNAQVVDPYQSDATVKSSVYIEQGKIAAIGADADARSAEHTIDLQGKY
ncbi:MAG: hypothetical protein OEM52_10775 [bacterium]|nr:hypothetical protein [bacterium]